MAKSRAQIIRDIAKLKKDAARAAATARSVNFYISHSKDEFHVGVDVLAYNIVRQADALENITSDLVYLLEETGGNRP